jgi:hypothetical protein
MKISQSLMKSFAQYKQGEECGLVVKAKYVDGKQSPSSDAMRLGQYFEYEATGALPAYGDGTPPEPELVYKGKPNEKLATSYQRAYESAQYFKAMAKALNIEIIEVGKRLENETMSGTTDLWVKWNDRICIVDLKYSGLLDNKWDDLGWHEDFLEQKDKLLAQAVHYKYLAEEEIGENVPFYFFVFSSTDPSDVRIFEIVVDSSKTEQHLIAVNNTKVLFEREMKNDSWNPLPNLKRCNKCFLNETCEYRALLPEIKQIFY